ncbi:hypothetical protein [Nonomuraea rubra]|uniref:hypothetical protein n=1 Tax=Nonomuraea rubra TaxID=46180 RepID=UPI0033EEDFC6
MAGILFIGPLPLSPGICNKPLSDYSYRVYSGTRHFGVGRGIYRLLGVNSDLLELNLALDGA